MLNRMQTILVMNSKGGCGKTTLSTNLAGYFASQGFRTTIMDYDPQNSSLKWLKSRSPCLPAIHGANAAPSKGGGLRSIAMAVPASTEFLVIDAPAGVEGLMLREMVNKANFILVPVAPSSIDIHATADFIRDLLLVGRIRAANVKLGIVANRIRNSMPVYVPFERFLNTLKLPFLTRLSDSDQYIYAAEQGCGVFEMGKDETQKEREELQPIIDWLESCNALPRKTGMEASNVVSIDSIRQMFRE